MPYHGVVSSEVAQPTITLIVSRRLFLAKQMIKKLLAIIMLVMVASLSIAGCTSSTNSSQTSSSASQTASTTAHTTTSAAASATPAPPHLKVLFFYETNCPYCQALEPHVTKLQKTYAAKAPVQSIENYASPLASQYKVSSVPTLILLNNGHEVGRWVDVTNTTQISAKINSLLRAG
jgi:thiol-disulfide isomerase/thioredoxin